MPLISLVRRALATLLLFAASCNIANAADPIKVIEQLRALPGVTLVQQRSTSFAGTLFFQITFRQPVDHAHPEGPYFSQRAYLLHRDESLPMVLITDGYGSPNGAQQSELAFYLHTNQLRIEHRFFGTSRPVPTDWSKLDIAQAAADDHAVFAAFKTLYRARWVATGGSKGGMTAIYYGYFHPDDMDAIVAYSAPSSHGIDDERYVDFLRQVGSADCRERLAAFQRTALAHRDVLVKMIPEGDYTYFGRDRSLEFAVIEFPFAFWATQPESSCKLIPGDGADDKERMDWLLATVGIPDDTYLISTAPYYYQAATQLGWPRADDPSLAKWLRYPREDIPQNFPPLDVKKPFDPTPMPIIEDWVRRWAHHLILVYGERDPWSATAFQITPDNEAYRMYVRGEYGTHATRLQHLSDTDRQLALLSLRDWLDLPYVYGPVAAPEAGEVEDPALDPYPMLP